MSKATILPIFPSPIPEEKFSQNDDVCSGNVLRRIASSYNFTSAQQRKHLFAKHHFFNDVPTMGSSSEETNWFVCRTGENTESIEFMLGMWPPSSVSSTSQGYCYVEMYDGTNTITSDSIYYPLVKSGINGNRVFQRMRLTAADDSLLSNTEYRVKLVQKHYVRVFSFSAWENSYVVADSSNTGVCDPLNWETHAPVEDAGVQDLAQTGTKLWQHNGSQLISFGRATASDAPTFSGTTEKLLLDTSITGGTWSSTNPSFILNTQYHDSHSGDVPVVLGVYATRTAGSSGLNVYIKRNGSTIISQTGIGTTMAPFNSSTHTITARASDQVEIWCSCQSGLDTWRVDAIGLWEYEA